MKLRHTVTIILALSHLGNASAFAAGVNYSFSGKLPKFESGNSILPDLSMSTRKAPASAHFGEEPAPIPEPAPKSEPGPQSPPEPFPPEPAPIPSDPNDPNNPYPMPNPNPNDPGNPAPRGDHAYHRIFDFLHDGQTPVFNGLITSKDKYIHMGNRKELDVLMAHLPPDMQGRLRAELESNANNFIQRQVAQDADPRWRDPVGQMSLLAQGDRRASFMNIFRHHRTNEKKALAEGRTIAEKIEILRRQNFANFLAEEARLYKKYAPRSLDGATGRGSPTGKIIGFGMGGIGLGVGGTLAYSNWDKISKFFSGTKKDTKDAKKVDGKNQSTPVPDQPSTSTDDGLLKSCKDVPGSCADITLPAPPAPPKNDGLELGTRDRSPGSAPATQPGELQSGPVDPFAAADGAKAIGAQ